METKRVILVGFASILHFLPFFLVNSGHMAIKVHVNKVQCCRAGHL